MTPMITLDPVYAKFCKESVNWPKLYEKNITVVQLREMMSECPNLPTDLPEVLEEDITVKHNGIELRLTLFRPVGTENEILPVVIFYHGGGYVLHCKYAYTKSVRDICVNNHVAVVYPNLSLTPEHTYPTAVNESFETLRWVAENGESIKVDSSKIAICGGSSGATMCAFVPFLAKEHGLVDIIKTQILIYPGTSILHENYESAKLFGDGNYFLCLKDVKYIESLYFKGCDINKIRFPSMATREELSNFPTTLIITAEADPFRDEGEQYGRQLIEAGVATTTVRILGTVHGYITVLVSTPAYKQTMAMITSQLKEAFEKK